ncbi:MAG: HlyD family efflux transporter periplasmic adaptor subunit [Planctomycetota bacterium]
MGQRDTIETNHQPSAWQTIEQTIASLSELAGRETSVEAFASVAVARVSELTHAEAVVCWQVHQDQVSPIAEIGWASISSEIEAENHAFVAEAIGNTKPTLCSSLPGSRAVPRRLVVAATFRDQRGVAGVFEVLFSDVGTKSLPNDDRYRGAERLLGIVAELMEQTLRHKRLRDLQTSEDRWQQFELLVSRVHGSLRLEETAFQLVNDGRVFVECDRVGLIVSLNGRLKAVAVSNVDVVQRRSELVQKMETLAEVISNARTWVKYRGDTTELPPQIQDPLCAYADVSHAQAIDVVPLLDSPQDVSGDEDSDSRNTVGVLIFERFDSAATIGSDKRISQLSTLATVAVRNAIDYSTLPFLGFARAMRGVVTLGSGGKRAAVVLASSLFAFVLLGMVPVPFSVDATGRLQPTKRRNLFAPRDVEVVEVLCKHDEIVEKDAVLLQLRSRELELKVQELRGEQQTTRKQLLAVTSARFQRDVTSDYRLQRQYAAREQELQETLKSLDKQLALLRREREALTVCSPIDGRVLTWNPAEELEGRPIARGMTLLTLADTDAAWEVELQIPDRDIGRIIEQRADGQPLTVRFALAAGGDQVFVGSVQSIAARSEVDSDGKAKVRVLASVEASGESFRSGETVFADVDCGRRPLAFVLFHRMFDAVWRWLWL